MSDIHVFAKIQPAPDHYADVLGLLRQIVPATREESGCLRFELNRGIDDGCLYLVEIWTSEAALEMHHQKSYTVAAAKRISGKLIADTIVTKMTAVD